MALTLSKLAHDLGLDLRGEDREVTGVNTLDHAGPSEVTFFANPKYAGQLSSTRAAAVIIDETHASLVPTALVSKNPYLDFVRTVTLFSKPQGCLTGVSDLAYIHPEAKVDPSATVYPFVFVGARATVGAGSTIFPGCYVGEDSTVGSGCILYPNAVLMAGTCLGDRIILQAGAVLGSDGFGFAQSAHGFEKFPQIGHVVLEDEVEIGANAAIDRAALGETRIGGGTKIDNLVQIGHNVTIGERSILVAQVGIAGSTKLGKGVVLAGQVGVTGHLSIGDGVRVAAQSGIHRDVPTGTDVGGYPAMESGTYRRVMASLPRLPELLRRVRQLERELENMQQSTGGGTSDE